MKYEINYEGLKKYLESLTYDDIKKGALTKAHTRYDIDSFYKTDKEKSKITLNQVVEYGKPFLVDAVGNDLSVCILTRRKYKLPTGRVAKMKLDKIVIDDCRALFGTPLNELFVIPDKFITHK